MKKIIISLLSTATAAMFLVFFANVVEGVSIKEKERYLLGFYSIIDYQLIDTYEGEIIREYQHMPAVLVELTQHSAKKISKESNVLYIETDDEVSVTSISPVNMSTEIIPWGFDKINAVVAHHEGFKGEGIKIGIIDSGIDYTHGDLNVVNGINFVEDSMDYSDDFGHGTAVAGIIGALENSEGIIGVAPQSELYAIKVLDSIGNGFISDVVSGIEWAIRNELDIVNLSLSTNSDSKTLSKAVKTADKNGILLVSSAGNEGYHSKGNITYPGAYKSVIAVGAIDNNNLRTSFSSVGKELEIMAPGASIYSTSINGQYNTYNGTSFAAPYIVGAAALIWEANPELDSKEVRKILNNTATDLGDKYLFGNGLVDIQRAFNSF